MLKSGDKCTVIGDVIKKHNKTQKVYCKAGDKVKVISMHGLDVAIVEGKERYSINVKYLKHEGG